ncbi:NnrU family protein [Glacieibacterium frigidum]|uniref:MFS transporter n=1 Tax=Glacieibacterium frigidum TaxID=2593303 RepID=A0A552UI07_9SPHN|nr:NnrU family protein [Glacieibacterium frigidum]TRW17852.1 MFS transporter [Glacieibacterium frigidum]
MTVLLIALASFVGTHLLLSHALRPPLVAALGEKGFTGVYSLVAAVTLGWAVWAWGRAEVVPLWSASPWVWWAAVPVMLLASVLFVGSVSAPNPALMGDLRDTSGGPRGVQAITRHPMMWSFALWALVHAIVSGDARTVALCVAVGGLALVGARFQDGKKRGQLGERWAAHEAATSFVPFARGVRSPGLVALLGGVVLLVVAMTLHPIAGGPDLWSIFA